MASPLYPKRPSPPGIYRFARALRRLSTIVLVLIIVFVAVVAYSAIQVVKSQPRVGNSSYTFEPNETVGVFTSFSLSNPTYFAIQQFALQFRISNGTDVLLVDSSVGPINLPAGASQTIPIDLYVPLTAAGTSLLTENQYLQWDVWGNASYAYLFSVSIGVQTERSWGAPFNNLTVQVGTPALVNGTESIPVTLAFSNDANFADVGSLTYQVVPQSGPDCSQGAFALNVPSDTSYDETQNVVLASGCNPSGGHVDAEFVGSGFTVPLPPEAIP
ncbi:MAG: hypothetical protein L3J68_02110 [Thermoplasmata archaeon]|nr:hypothetical protein [Thermoplasmata archaeon]